MTISARVHYASIALIELAMRSDDVAPVTIREISDRHGIPGPFLVQILRTLRSFGWVQSLRGSQGGYRLLVDSAEITLLDITEAIGCQEPCPRSETSATLADEILQQTWEQATQAWRDVLSQVRLSDLVERCRHGDATMFYI